MDLKEQIQGQVGSTGKKGWPVAVRDRIAFPKEGNEFNEDNVAVTFLWTMRDAVLPKLEKQNLAIATNFYTPAGLAGMVRNILANPCIRYIILLGEEYACKSPENTGLNELTSANALRAFFGNGISAERKVPGFESSVHFDKHIPTELIQKVIESVELIDLNKKMLQATLDEKISEANKLLGTLARKKPFLDRPYTFDYEATMQPFPFEGGPMLVRADNIPKAWVEMIYTIYRYGRENLMNANTDRWVKEINNMTVVVHDPQNADLSFNPFIIPLTKEKIEAYQKEILSPVLLAGKAYTYGNELRAYYFPSKREIHELVSSTEFKDFEFGRGKHLDKNIRYLESEACEINQIADITDALKRDPYSKACVAITWHPANELMRKHKSSPCLVFLQAMVQDEKLNLTVFFRSHDMTQGWPENAYGCAAIQKEIAGAISLPCGILTIISGSAQIYNNYYKQVEEMLAKYRKFEPGYNDAMGNFIIGAKDGKITAVRIHPETHAELEKASGTTAGEVCLQLASFGPIETSHALYLGAELQKAEFAIKNNLEYTQDQPLKEK